MDKYVWITNNGELNNEVFDSKTEAEEWLAQQVRDGDVSASEAEDYEPFELMPRSVEVKVAVNVNIC